MEQLVARRAHNPKVVGSSPAPATSDKVSSIDETFFLCPVSLIYHVARNGVTVGTVFYRALLEILRSAF